MSSKTSYWDYHLKQYELPYRSTASFMDFVKKRLSAGEKVRILDAGCGAGANIHWLKQVLPEAHFVGLDMDRDALKIALQKNPDTSFHYGDFLESAGLFGIQQFDYLFAVQFISFVPFDLSDFLACANKLVKKGLFLTSLFSESNIEQTTTATDIENGWSGLYKIYSIPRLRDLAAANGFSRVAVEPFVIDIDLPKPIPFKFGTYTVNTIDGEKLQMSGYMQMPWYNIYIGRE